jgi:hypothetical protein
MNNTIRLLLEQKYGRRIRYHKDCDGLALAIKSLVGEPVSASTLKRFFGFIKNAGSPSLYTLDIISRFLDQPDWDSLQKKISEDNELFFSDSSQDFLRSKEIMNGSEIELGCSENQKIVLHCMGNCMFRVLECMEFSLVKNDMLEIYMFGVSFPLFVHSIKREDKILGPYMAFRKNGIGYVKTRPVPSKSSIELG